MTRDMNGTNSSGYTANSSISARCASKRAKFWQRQEQHTVITLLRRVGLLVRVVKRLDVREGTVNEVREVAPVLA